MRDTRDDPESREQLTPRRRWREMEACDDPICCCEAEPRWLRFEKPEAEVGEWEVLERSPSDEL